MATRGSTQLVIFDCDGVLVDSEELGTRVLLELLAEHRVELDWAESHARFRGGKLADVLATIQIESGRQLPDAFVPEFRARTARVFLKELRAIDGVGDVLDRLSVPYCVASSGPIEKITLSLRCCGLLSRFENRIFSSYEIGSWKPEPGLFLHAAQRLGVDPRRVTVVEDSAVGVQAGVAAGMNVLGFAPPERSTELEACGARVFWPMRGLLDHL